MLEKVQVSPGFWFSVMDYTVSLPTNRAGEKASFGKVNMNIKSFLVNVKLAPHNLPWGCQHQGKLYKFSFFHG
jgi:hypothetical protein